MFDMAFADDDLTGYIAGVGTVYKSTDGGFNWTTCSLKVNSPGSVYSMSTMTFKRVLLGSGPDPIVIIAGPVISAGTDSGMPLHWRSVDGCATWREMLPVSGAASTPAYGPFTRKAGDQLIAAGKGKIVSASSAWATDRTNAVGMTRKSSWVADAPTSTPMVQTFSCFDASVCVAISNAGSSAYTTTDGGVTWTKGGVAQAYSCSVAYCQCRVHCANKHLVR